MADKKISELDLTLQINNDAVFPMSQENAGEPTTFKAAITQLGTKIAEDMTFSNLQTTSKTLVGAINELLSLGSPIIIGTTAPTSSQGADGNIYIQYTEGTGGADDEVDGIYVKIDGAWCEISTGGGGGTTDYEDLSNKPQVNSVELVGNKTLDDLGIMPASLSKTVSGSIVHITDGGDNIPVKSLVSEIVAVESGSGTKSPTNPYTISGFDSGVVTRLGKNFFDFSPTTVTSSRTIASNIFLKAGNYVCSFLVNNTTAISGYFQVRIGTTSIGGVNFGANYRGIVSKAFTLSEDSTVNIFVGGASAGYNFEFSNGQIELGSTATTYEAYNGNTYTFAFGQTVYGGHFDNKGNLVVTKVAHIFDGSESFISLESGTVFAYDFGAGMLVNSQVAQGKSLSTHFIEVDSGFGWNSVTSGKFLVAGNRYFGCNPNMSLADYKTFLTSQYQANTPVKAICLLANPITLTITSQDIPTLLGENNIFSNCGDLEVTYYTDNADEIVELAKSTASTSLHNYSTEEQVIGTWVDGKTLYEKTWYFQSSMVPIYRQWTSLNINVSDLDIAEIVDHSAQSYASQSVSIDVWDDNETLKAQYWMDGLNVGSVTIRYTKTT